MTSTTNRSCSHISTCELFPRFSLRASLKVWQTYYCESAFENCARYVRSLEGRRVPPNLLPNGKELDLDRALRSGIA